MHKPHTCVWYGWQAAEVCVRAADCGCHGFRTSFANAPQADSKRSRANYDKKKQEGTQRLRKQQQLQMQTQVSMFSVLEVPLPAILGSL